MQAHHGVRQTDRRKSNLNSQTLHIALGEKFENGKKVKYVDLYNALSRSASNALPFPVSRRWSPQANPTARHSANTARPRIRVGVSRDMPVYCAAYAGYSFSLGRIRLSRPGSAPRGFTRL